MWKDWVCKSEAYASLSELWCWRRLLRVPWTARRSNQSILKEISPEYSLEGLMVKLKLQSFGHLMQRTDLFENTLMLGKIEGRRRRGMTEDGMVWGITDAMDMNLSKLRKLAMDREAWLLQSMGSQRVRHDWATQLNWVVTVILPLLLHSIKCCVDLNLGSALYQPHIFWRSNVSVFHIANLQNGVNNHLMSFTEMQPSGWKFLWVFFILKRLGYQMDESCWRFRRVWSWVERLELEIRIWYWWEFRGL